MKENNFHLEGDFLIPAGVEKINLEHTWRLVDVMVKTKLAKSVSEARRLIEGGAVSISMENDEEGLQKIPSNLRNPILVAPYTYILKVGKRRWTKAHLK